MLHVVFHANIGEEEQSFSLHDVVEAITAKLIRRHPHVFGDEQIEGAQNVIKNWEKLKMREGRASLLDGVPKELPALLRAHRLTERASRVGFDWKKKENAWAKVEEEIRELHLTIDTGEKPRTEEEFGDVLFALVNYSRFIGVNPENALRRTVDRFTQRFRYIEKRLIEQGKDVHSSSLEEMDRFWEEAEALS